MPKSAPASPVARASPLSSYRIIAGRCAGTVSCVAMRPVRNPILPKRERRDETPAAHSSPFGRRLRLATLAAAASQRVGAHHRANPLLRALPHPARRLHARSLATLQHAVFPGLYRLQARVRAHDGRTAVHVALGRRPSPLETRSTVQSVEIIVTVSTLILALLAICVALITLLSSPSVVPCRHNSTNKWWADT
jgi:hypothetical protein